MAGNSPHQAEGYRDGLRLLCYRMSGSLREAEDLAEEALLRAGGPPTGGAGSPRSGLLAAAARLCLDALAERPPRGLPRLLSPPSDPILPPREPEEGAAWLEPFPDQLYPENEHGGGRRYGEREAVSLPFIAALQSLRPRERLCLILADAMGRRAAALEEVLGAGTAEAEGFLEEARACMSLAYDEGLGTREPPPGDMAPELMMRYLHPWEAGDVEALVERLSEDAVLQSPPFPSWYEGRDAVGQHLASYSLRGGARGRWRLLPRRSNGQLAFGIYRLDGARRVYAAHSIQVLHFSGELVSEIVAFRYPDLFPWFGLLGELDVQGQGPSPTQA